MSGETKVDTKQLSAGAQQLNEVAEKLTKIRDDLRSKLDAEGQAWGSDKPGTTHGSGYTPQEQHNLEATENRIDGMIQYVQGIEDAAKNFDKREEGNAKSYKG